MPNPGSVSNQMPSGRPADLAYRVDQLERLVQRMAAARSLENATINNAPGLGVRTSDFDGTSFADHGTKGNYFGGDGAVLNSLYLRPGSVSNDILTHPVTFDGNGGSTANFAVSRTATAIVSCANTVPAGMTKMASFVWGSVCAVAPGTGADYLNAYVTIAQGSSSFGGNQAYNIAQASEGTQVTATKYGLLTGLTPGSTVTHSLTMWAGNSAWAANSMNIAEVEVLILWSA